jgi:hypothetical protein
MRSQSLFCIINNKHIHKYNHKCTSKVYEESIPQSLDPVIEIEISFTGSCLLTYLLFLGISHLSITCTFNYFNEGGTIEYVFIHITSSKDEIYNVGINILSLE